MNTQNILNALRNISLVWTLTPDEYDLYYIVLDIYQKVREYKNERNYKDEEIEFQYQVGWCNFLIGIEEIFEHLGDLKCERDEEFPQSTIWISIKKKEN